MVAVEFQVLDDRLRDVVVTGDFFLYPEEALPILAQSLEGAPAGLSRREFAERVQSALTSDVHLLGSSADGLATAVTRALAADNAPEDGNRGG